MLNLLLRVLPVSYKGHRFLLQGTRPIPTGHQALGTRHQAPGTPYGTTLVSTSGLTSASIVWASAASALTLIVRVSFIVFPFLDEEVSAELQSRLADAESVLRADREREQGALREAAARATGLDEPAVRQLMTDLMSIDKAFAR